jgi:adenosylhomocysteinase
MLISIRKIGERIPEGFESALHILRRYQTVWKFNHGPSVEKINSSKGEDNLIVLPIEEDCFNIGITTGKISQNGRLNVIDHNNRRAIISDYEFMSIEDMTPPEIFWAASLFNILLRALLGHACDKPTCFCSKNLTIDNLCVRILQIGLCNDCCQRLENKIKYNIPEVREIVNRVKRHGKYENLSLFIPPELPVLQRQIRRLEISPYNQIFEPYGIVIVMHFLEDLIPFLDGLIRLGAHPEAISVIVKPYPYSQRAKVHEYLIDHYPTISVEYLQDLFPTDELLNDIMKTIKDYSRSGKIIVIEDGGYIVPFLHRTLSKVTNYCVGAVEQTTKGIRKDEEIMDYIFPILNVAKSEFKDQYEAPLVGKAIVYNIQQLLPSEKFSGEKALVIGYGAIGKRVANELRNMGVIVHVADLSQPKIVAARESGFPTETAENLIKDCRIIIGTTGKQSIGEKELEKMKNGAILISASSDQIEIDINHLKIMAKKIKYYEKFGTKYIVEKSLSIEETYILLADGFPINFFFASGIPNKAIDPILAQLFIGAVEIAKNQGMEAGIQNIMDKLIEENKLLDDFIAVYHST